MFLPVSDWLCMGGYLGGISSRSGSRLPSDQTEHLEIIQRRRSSARLAHTDRNCQGDKQKSLKLFEEVEMEMRSQMEEVNLNHARVDRLVMACLESEPHNPIPTQAHSGVTLPFAASGSRCLAFMSLRPFYYLFRPTPSRATSPAKHACDWREVLAHWKSLQFSI